MQINFNNISNEEKDSLKNQILHGLIELKQKEAKRRKKKRLIAFSAAASVALLAGLFLNRTPESKPKTDLELFAEKGLTTESNADLENISLVMQDQKTIAVEDSSVISYGKNGKKVTVGEQAINTNSNSASFNTVRVPYGKRTQIVLTDGTTVWLNSGSSLIYPTQFDGSIREVYLTGEAAFDVAHNKAKPFFVKTKECNVRVLGTVFNVSSYPEDETVQTALLQGKVRITYNKKGLLSSKEIQEDLTPGMIATINKDKKQLKVERKDVASILSWREGYFTFKSQSLNTILGKLSKYYKIEFIKGANLNLDANYSGSFALNENLNSLANTLSSITNNSCTVNANQRTITIK
ncbi:ferric-dicitrate binding protein FerR (iron transport regulator) [Flavobacterium nitrogenifigens]|uniref:Ferric-dicitrate binding protein FerR (Iron transport regulator) n=2 Tax=Flavobacterium TaxID=237 RepID=A0A7W7IXQ1_9FLAO|nr:MULTISPECIES: FecR domain-containing protein [Flavobacterium]MBB4802529.1 ferric-dicitrate binding protein FerR (iron transport regulator) [Flavobacterium nitrogenifigens]MBB6387487.1 ferric-dicitrate binding protein FerR (iron transport regulator) [Flavobacterium notoginsengisoli]